MAGLVSVLLLILVFLSLHIASASQVAAGDGQQQLPEKNGHAVSLPLLFRSDWLSRCYAPETEYYQLLIPVPNKPEIDVYHSATITVTTAADTINGDVSSVPKLILNPGPDGIALREAITATNNDPGSYTILFSETLTGSTIYTGAEKNNDLPPLLSGGVIIDGDIDGDLAPDITLTSASELEYPVGIKIQSGANTLHALELQGYSIGVAIEPTRAITTYQGIAISDMVIRDGLMGINLGSGPDVNVRSSYNHFEDFSIINNEILVSQDGITFKLDNATGDRLDNVVIHNNNISITRKTDKASFGIQLMAGFGADSVENLILDVVITNNTIRGNPDQAIAVVSGAAGSGGNVIDGVILGANEILISDTNFSIDAGMLGISLITGEPGTDIINLNHELALYPQSNVIRNIDVIGNKIEGFDGRGIQVLGGCCGAQNNSIENINILKNQIQTSISNVEYDVTGILVRASNAWPDPQTAENVISGVVIQQNEIVLDAEMNLTDTHFMASAISINGQGGGAGGRANQVRDIWISLNQVESVVPAINLSGAWEGAKENVISNVNINCNFAANDPIYPLGDPGLKAIVLIGGMSGSTLNRVENVSLFHNDVAGIRDDLTVIPNAADTAINNVVDYQIIPAGLPG